MPFAAAAAALPARAWRRLESLGLAAAGALQTLAFVHTAQAWLPLATLALLVWRLNAASPGRAAWLAWYGTTADAPCIAICSTSQGDAICKGCGRSFEEVQHWTAISPAEKRAVWHRISQGRLN